MSAGGRWLVVIFLGLLGFCSAVCSCAKVGVQRVREGAAAIDTPMPYPIVHFLFDRDRVAGRELPRLDENAKWLRQNGAEVVILEGHADEWGRQNYNVRLGDRRARMVKAYLIDKGVPYGRLTMVVSRGETCPIDPAHNREAWRKNRRVEFILR